MAELLLNEGAPPPTPSTGKVSVYAKVDGLVYSKDDLGVETALGVTGSGVSDGDKGDITVSAGGTVWTIDPGVVSFAKMQPITDGMLLGASGGTAIEEITVGAGLSLTGNILNSTISQYTNELAQDAVGSMIDSSLLYDDVTPLFQRAALTGDVTASAGSNTTTIANDAVTNAKAANMATATLKGRVTAGTGDPEDLTATQATSLLNTFTDALKGLVPASGGGTTNFLRADGTFAAPAGSGQTAIQMQDEGSNLGTSGTVDTVNFVGAGVTASRATNTVTVTIAGGAGITQDQVLNLASLRA